MNETIFITVGLLISLFYVSKRSSFVKTIKNMDEEIHNYLQKNDQIPANYLRESHMLESFIAWGGSLVMSYEWLSWLGILLTFIVSGIGSTLGKQNAYDKLYYIKNFVNKEDK